MLKRRFAAGLGLLGVLGSPCPAFAGAWTLPAGSGQAGVITTVSSATRGFDGSGLTPTPRYDKTEVQGLIEYGITDQLTVIGSPGLQHIDIAAPTDARRTGLGYTELGGRYRLLQADSWVLSGQATMRVPGTNDTSNPAAIGYTGVETDIRGLFGYSFAFRDLPAFVDLQVAQRFRAGGPPSELRADATFGVQVAPQWLLLAQSFNVVSEGAGNAPFASYEYYKLQLSAVYSLTKSVSLQLGGFTTYAGRNALQENGMILGVWYKF
jgi:protein XagA